ncbi:hypothetical protein DFH06DRAFT_1193308 [Mycena polygramma]|nr:hypothetical protein DFH06DRAFT_1193308 [Mycena polygramma]
MSVLGAPEGLLDYQTPEGYRRMRATYSDQPEQVANANPLVDHFTQAISEDAEKFIESLKSAKAPALFAMAQAWQHCEKEIIPGHILLKTFLHHVDGANVPKLPILPVENDSSERAWASFIGLRYKFVSQIPANPDFRTRLMAAWPGIFKWCRYFYRQRVSAVADFGTQQNIDVISGLISDLLMDSKLLQLIRGTEGIVTLCTQLWMHRAAPPISSLMMHTLLRESTWEELSEVVATAGDKADSIAQTAVSRLRTAMNQSPRPPHTRLPRHRLTNAVLEENACWVATRLLVVVADVYRTSGPHIHPQYEECVNAGFSFLRFALVRDDSPRWVAQAVDAGLLRVICELAPLLEEKLHQFCRDNVQHILHDTLPKHMVYLRVVKLVDRELDEIDEATANAGVGRTWLRDDWLSLLHLTAVRSAVAKLPKRFKGTSRIPCESTTCGNSGTKSELRRCTGCMYVYYCGKKCQKDGWPNHRGICKVRSQNRANKEERDRSMFSDSDARFFRELFSGDVEAHWSHLHKLAARNFPTVKGEHFAVCLDYTNPAYPMGTCSLKDIRTYEFPPMNGEDKDREDVVAENNELINMVRRSPKNYSFIEASFAWGERRISRNFMMRPNMWDNVGTAAVNWDGKKMCENEDAQENGTGLLQQLLGLNLGGGLELD